MSRGWKLEEENLEEEELYQLRYCSQWSLMNRRWMRMEMESIVAGGVVSDLYSNMFCTVYVCARAVVLARVTSARGGGQKGESENKRQSTKTFHWWR